MNKVPAAGPAPLSKQADRALADKIFKKISANITLEELKHFGVVDGGVEYNDAENTPGIMFFVAFHVRITNSNGTEMNQEEMDASRKKVQDAIRAKVKMTAKEWERVRIEFVSDFEFD